LAAGKLVSALLWFKFCLAGL